MLFVVRLALASERLQVQVATYVNRNIYKSESSAERARVRAMREFLRIGAVTVRGVKIVGRWRNPDNRQWKHRNWKTTEDADQSLEEFWETLHGSRGALRGLRERYL